MIKKQNPVRGAGRKSRLYVVVESSAPKKFPDGEIGFSEYYLQEQAKIAEHDSGHLLSIDDVSFDIARLSSHEVRHLKQKKIFLTS